PAPLPIPDQPRSSAGLVPADERRFRFRCEEGSAKSGSKDLVKQDLGFVLLDTLRKSELGDQNLPSLCKHALLAGRQAALALAAPEIADNLGDLQHIAGVKLLEIGFVPARPVGWLLGVGCAKNTKNSFQTVSVNNVTDSNEVQVACRYADYEITLANNSQYEIKLGFTLDLPGFDVL